MIFGDLFRVTFLDSKFEINNKNQSKLYAFTVLESGKCKFLDMIWECSDSVDNAYYLFAEGPSDLFRIRFYYQEYLHNIVGEMRKRLDEPTWEIVAMMRSTTNLFQKNEMPGLRTEIFDLAYHESIQNFTPIGKTDGNESNVKEFINIKLTECVKDLKKKELKEPRRSTFSNPLADVFEQLNLLEYLPNFVEHRITLDDYEYLSDTISVNLYR